MSNSTLQPPTTGQSAGKHELPEAARQKISSVKAIPAMPAILMPLLELLQKPTDQVPVDEVVRLVSYDKTIAAQCLRIAGSPLFGLSRAPDTIRSAVISMGITRLKDVVLTFSLGQILPAEKFIIDPEFSGATPSVVPSFAASFANSPARSAPRKPISRVFCTISESS